MSTIITTSSNLTLLESRIFANVCIGQFTIDLSPSVFLGSGASSVLGARVQITNPYGVVIKAYGSGAYDIVPPMTAAYEIDIPTQASKIQYGVYTIAVKLVDAGGTEYVVTKTVNVCTYTSDSHPCDERLRVVADCKNGKLSVALAEPPVFKGKFADSMTHSIDVTYPTASGLADFTTTYQNFNLALFQGVYLFEVEVCATYDMGDNVYLQLPYTVSLEKNVKCLLDYTCIYPAIKRLHDKIDSNCSQKDKDNYASIALSAVFALQTAEMANLAGEDASTYISDLEELLGCQCTCDCSGSPIVNGEPAGDVTVEGCAVTSTVVGLTKVFTIDSRNYYLTLDDSQNILTLSAVSEYGCVAYQQLGFNVGNLYTAFKSQINTSTEYDYWSSVINNSLSGIDASCLGYSTSSWNAFTFKQKIAALVAAACGGAACTTSVTGLSASQSGADVLILFTQTGGFSADVYVDGIFKGNVLLGIGQLLVPNLADGATHTYVVVPKCSNGSQGTPQSSTFGFIGCPSIAPPSLTDNTVNGVTCPYDLTTLIYPEPPVGIEVEWHTANNTLNSTLVADPENVSAGVYYAFAKDSNDCYSAANAVTVICDGATSCTAPQSLLVVVGVGGNKVSFQSASAPPPLNSYTVKRKAFADPDVDGSYTTIGTPTWNSTTSRWEITDATAVDNTLYTYKAISNCSASTPSVLYTFANIDCPTLSAVLAADEIEYSFTDVGGEVDKYEVSIYDTSGLTLIATDTIVPAFSTPITGTFIYLTAGTNYKVRVKVFIGSYSKTCDFVSYTTDTGDSITNPASMSLGSPSMSGTIEVASPAGRTLRFANFSVCGNAAASVTISGGIGTINNNIVSGTPNDSQNVDTFLPMGTYTFTGSLVSGCTNASSIYFI